MLKVVQATFTIWIEDLAPLSGRGVSPEGRDLWPEGSPRPQAAFAQ